MQSNEALCEHKLCYTMDCTAGADTATTWMTMITTEVNINEIITTEVNINEIHHELLFYCLVYLELDSKCLGNS